MQISFEYPAMTTASALRKVSARSLEAGLIIDVVLLLGRRTCEDRLA